MSLFNFKFFCLIFSMTVGYYVFPELQKYILLLGSLVFYVLASPLSTAQDVSLILYITSITYFGALIIVRTKGKVRSCFTGISIILLVMPLVTLKYAYNLAELLLSPFRIQADFSFLSFLPVIGISYYALSAIGYLVDVSWSTYNAERNPVNIGLFVFYFPQVISGPITRFDQMNRQFEIPTALKYENISHGMRRMLWGYFKKLVISERLAIIVSAVFGDYTSYSAVGICAATICYAGRLYTDFSGCMDIIMGTSTLFGIELPKNFKAPFFSKTVQEFWQRWHITLGVWFKDYVMYPLQKSMIIRKIGDVSKKRLGKKCGKKISLYLSMSVLWLLLGVWHGGTGYYFLAAGIIPCLYLVIGDILHPFFGRMGAVLKIDTVCFSWRVIQSVRTGLALCVCWFFVCAGSVSRAVEIIGHMLSHPIAYTPFAVAMNVMDIGATDVLLVCIGCAALCVEDYLVYNGMSVYEKMDRQNVGFRFFVIGLEAATVCLCGLVGTSEFIYFQF